MENNTTSSLTFISDLLQFYGKTGVCPALDFMLRYSKIWNMEKEKLKY